MLVDVPITAAVEWSTPPSLEVHVPTPLEMPASVRSTSAVHSVDPMPLTISGPMVAALESLKNTSGGRNETPAVGVWVVVKTVRHEVVKFEAQPAYVAVGIEVSMSIVPLAKLLAGRDCANIESFITMLHEYKPDSPYHHFMPPMVGTEQDVDDLANFLNAQVNPPATNGQKPMQTAQK